MNKVLKKLNCWEFKNCEREHGEEKVNELGVCPVAIATEHDGKNKGKNAGRYCWKVDGTPCDQKYQNNRFAKFIFCTHCDFFNLVQQEEGLNFQI